MWANSWRLLQLGQDSDLLIPSVKVGSARRRNRGLDFVMSGLVRSEWSILTVPSFVLFLHFQSTAKPRAHRARAEMFLAAWIGCSADDSALAGIVPEAFSSAEFLSDCSMGGRGGVCQHI